MCVCACTCMCTCMCARVSVCVWQKKDWLLPHGPQHHFPAHKHTMFSRMSSKSAGASSSSGLIWLDLAELRPCAPSNTERSVTRQRHEHYAGRRQEVSSPHAHHTHTHTHTRARAHTRTHTHMHMHAHARTCTHTHTTVVLCCSLPFSAAQEEKRCTRWSWPFLRQRTVF